MSRRFFPVFMLSVLSACAQSPSISSAPSNTSTPQAPVATSATPARAPASPSPAKSSFNLPKQAEEYRLHYGLRDPFSKLVNYEGNGFESLYGVRNFRVVLEGVYYRGGANNTYNRNSVRGNSNPLQVGGLKNLCEEGFTEATYLYATNFKSVPHAVSCRTKDGKSNRLIYKQVNALMGSHEHELLQDIFEHIKGKIPGPIYDHCWNGWHASGYVAALSLMQFCGYSHSRADSYWVKDTDGNYGPYSGIRHMLSKFKPFDDLKISDRERQAICPQ